MAAQEPKPKRGPGRPRKTPAEKPEAPKATAKEAPKRGPGRPKKETPKLPPARKFRPPSTRLTLTPDVHAEIVSRVADDGFTLRQACLSIGVAFTTAKGWISDGHAYNEAGDVEHPCAAFAR